MRTVMQNQYIVVSTKFIQFVFCNVRMEVFSFYKMSIWTFLSTLPPLIFDFYI